MLATQISIEEAIEMLNIPQSEVDSEGYERALCDSPQVIRAFTYPSYQPWESIKADLKEQVGTENGTLYNVDTFLADYYLFLLIGE